MMVEADPKEVWNAIRDVGAVHTRLAPGFLVDTAPYAEPCPIRS